MSVHERLLARGVTLPAAVKPAAAFVPCVRVGDVAFVSGHIARRDGKAWAGQLGAAGLTTAEGQQAAAAAAVDLLATIDAEVGLDSVKRVVKLLVLVNSAPDFTEQHLVANGASELLQEAFGDAGRHARSAVGVAQLPLGACVEIEAVVQVA